MSDFVEIVFDVAMKSFENAESNGSRWRIGEFPTSKWLQLKQINLDEVVAFSKNMPDSKIVIIGEGDDEGFYVYSQKQKRCYKFNQLNKEKLQ